MERVSLSLIVIYTSNIEETLEFYRLLGLEFIKEQHGSGSIHYSCNLDTFVFEIYPASKDLSLEQYDNTTILGFRIPNLENTLRELKQIQIEPKSPPKKSEWGLWVNLKDPDGRVIQIVQSSP